MTDPNRKIRVLTGVLCAAVGLTAAGGVVAGLLPLPRPTWFLVMFEAVVLLAAVVGLLYAAGRVGGSAALTLACIGGTVALATLLGGLGAGFSLGEARPVSLIPLVGVRLAAAGVFGVLSVVLVLGSDARKWRWLGIGCLLVLPALVFLGMAALPQGRAVLMSVGRMPAVAAMALGIVLFLLLTGLAAAGVHLVMKAFGQPER